MQIHLINPAAAIKCLNKIKLSTSLHSHNCYQFLYIFRGMCAVQSGNVSLELKQNSFLIIKPEVIHKLTFPDFNEAECEVFQTKITVSEDLKIIKYLPDVTDCSNIKNEVEKTLDLISGILKNNQISSDKVEYAFLLLFELLSSIHNVSIVRDERITQIMEYIAENVRKKLSVSILAERLCLEKSYFIRLFHRNTGMSPLAYIKKKRMEMAKGLLLFSSAKINEIADSIGYEYYHHFAADFKKSEKVSPKEYRHSYISDR
ncbi:MAG TPA: hypothetical protein DC049_06695 [Spirochaetia bacterium]|nr:hypothetical protein [Spirochaetia bacterium]